MSVQNRLSRSMQLVAAAYFNTAERTWGCSEKKITPSGNIQVTPDLVAASVNMALACEIALKSQLPDDDKFVRKHDLIELRSFLEEPDRNQKTDQTRFLVKMYLGIDDDRFDEMLERNRNVFKTRRYYYENDTFQDVEYAFLMVFAASILEQDGYHYIQHEGNDGGMYLEIKAHIPFEEEKEIHDFPTERIRRGGVHR